MIVEHHFIELKQTQMCSSINDRTQTPESNLKHSSTHHKREVFTSIAFFYFAQANQIIQPQKHHHIIMKNGIKVLKRQNLH